MKFFFSAFIFIIIASCATGNKKPPPVNFSTMLYMENFDSSQIDHDIKFLKELNYVTNVKYVSKEEAKKKYITDGNNDWTNVLDLNPLPDSYEVEIDGDKFSKKDIEPFRSKVQAVIKNCIDVAMPTLMIKD